MDDSSFGKEIARSMTIFWLGMAIALALAFGGGAFLKWLLG